MKITQLVLAALLSMAAVANAQTVPGTIKMSWTLPTTGCTVGVTPCDNKPLTGADALTSVQVFVSTSPIADASTMAPTLTLGPGATTGTATISAVNGATLYGRIKACTAAKCGGFSAQVSQTVKLDIQPGVPTNVTIEIQIGS